MSDPRTPPPTSPLVAIPGLAMHGCGVFLLPFLVGFVAALMFESTEVVETGPVLIGLVTALLVPVSLAQIVGTWLKARRDQRWWRDRGELDLRRRLDIWHRHVRIVTMRGWTLLFAALGFIVLAIAAKWAQFGLLAVLGLFLFYFVTGWTIAVSALLVARFEANTRDRRGVAIQRAVWPTVVQTGDAVEEVFTFRNIGVPAGYLLIIENALPARLRTESRYVVGAGSARTVSEARGGLHATPRGHYLLGPANLSFQDVLGITRVSLPSGAVTDLKVLPRFRPLEVVEPPQSPHDKPDVRTRPHRFPTEDFFRFRDYAAGDDTRRIQWKLSLKAGAMMVRQPESREIPTEEMVLVLDSWIPKGSELDAAHGADEILDALVEAWLAMAKALVSRGNRVSLVAAAIPHGRFDPALESIVCNGSEPRVWQDLGARAAWQSRFDVPELVARGTEHASGIVFTARFTGAPPATERGQSTTWVFLDPVDALGAADRHWAWDAMGASGTATPDLPAALWAIGRWALLLPQPAGSDENGLIRQIRGAVGIRTTWWARRSLRGLARRRGASTLTDLLARGDALYRIERTSTKLRLVGVQGARR